MALSSAYVSTTRGNRDILITLPDLNAHDYGSNVHNVSHAMTSWVVFLADSPLTLTHGPKPPRVFNTFRRWLILNDFKECVNRYSALANKLLEFVGSRDDGLKTILFSEFKDTPIFKEFFEFMRTDNVEILSFLLSFLWFPKKTYYEDEELNTTALREWYSLEDKLSQISLPPDILLHNLRKILSNLSEGYAGHSLPKHGSGSVSEKGVSGTREKNENFSFDFKVKRFLRRKERGLAVEYLLPRYSSDWSSKEELAPLHARLSFVPKDLRKTRSICMEPISYMWMQQDVRILFERSIRESVFRLFINIKKQENNRHLAQLGSIDGSLDTIDLSSASDSVSWDLVKEIFPKKILVDLGLTRSHYVDLPDGRVHKARKFAPMGSALCFPVQSTIYASVVIYAAYIRYSLRRRVSVSWAMDHIPIKKLFSAYDQDSEMYLPASVYGDDIVCDSRITPIAIDLLTSLGFTVNVSKSFLGTHPFRESCGGFYYKGQEVDVSLYKVKRLERKLHAQTLASLIELANAAYARGARNLHKFLVNTCLRWEHQGKRYTGLNRILFTNNPDDSWALLTSQPIRNNHLDRRNFDRDSVPSFSTCSSYQRDEWRSLTIKPEESYDIDESQYHWNLWMRSTLGRREDTMCHLYDTRTPTKVTRGARVGWRWTPAE